MILAINTAQFNQGDTNSLAPHQFLVGLRKCGNLPGVNRCTSWDHPVAIGNASTATLGDVASSWRHHGKWISNIDKWGQYGTMFFPLPSSELT